MITSSIFENMHIKFGPLNLTGNIFLTWILMALLFLVFYVSGRNLKQTPGVIQVILEGIVVAFERAIGEVIPGKVDLVFSFVATLWIFVLTANLFGLIPGMSSPTADLSVTLSLATIVFLSVHWFGIREQGLSNYLKHYLRPSPVLLPFHIISEFSRTLALAIRLFGNVMSLEIAAILVVMVAGIIVPIPLLMLHIVEALIQAYLFGMLALIYIAGGLASQEMKIEKEN